MFAHSSNLPTPAPAHPPQPSGIPLPVLSSAPGKGSGPRPVLGWLGGTSSNSGTGRRERTLPGDAEVLDTYRTCFGIVLDHLPSPRTPGSRPG
jgi:hypothetical protein